MEEPVVFYNKYKWSINFNPFLVKEDTQIPQKNYYFYIRVKTPSDIKYKII